MPDMFWTASGSAAAFISPALATFLVYTLAVFLLAGLSSWMFREKNFVSEYFLGSRSLGVWALALTYAATSASGGTFTGFPSLIYTHGWVLALWIGSYMVFPIVTMGLLGKRLNQVSRRSGAITVPDILRDRFESPGFGLFATLLIVFFTAFNLVAQFKAGSVILQSLLQDVPLYQRAVVGLGGWLEGGSLLSSLQPGYVLCLGMFAFAVILYTAWGGFHAVVWTDVMQGIVMVLGVVIMLPLTLYQVGGLSSATQQLAQMIPPAELTVRVARNDDQHLVTAGTWIRLEEDGRERIIRLREKPVFAVNSLMSADLRAIEIIDSGDRDRILSGAVPVPFTSDARVSEIVETRDVRSPANPRQQGAYVTAPGPSIDNEAGFLPLSAAFSFFVMWALSGAGQPSGMVRLMAFRETRTLRRSIVTVCIYFSFIYIPLVAIFCCSRILLPGMETESDRIMPTMTVTLTRNAGMPWLAGLLIAAPFAAVMSTVDSFLLMISSSVVRDIYQRNINPHASDRTVRRISYACTLLVGCIVAAAALNPPEFLQMIIIYVNSGLAVCFLAPVALAVLWPRVTRRGAIASMVTGFLTHLALYSGGWYFHRSFKDPLRPLGLDPIVIGIAVAFAAGIVVSLRDAPPPQHLIERYFCRKRTTPPTGDRD